MNPILIAASRFAFCLCAAVAAIACDPAKPAADNTAAAPKDAKIRLAFVTNNKSEFWLVAKAGVDKAAAETGASVEFRMPGSGAPEQKSMVESLLSTGVQGVAISPIDPANQTAFLDSIAAKVPLICHDSDAPTSKRLYYLGTNNVNAGRAAGELIKKTLPDGGKIALFVGSMDAQNAKDRAQGIKDVIAGSNITIVGTFTDNADQTKAVQNVQDAIGKNPDLACVVGLYSYNGPAMVSALKKANAKGRVKAVAFDDEAGTLDGIKTEFIAGTIVQQQFEFGYQSVKLLVALLKKEEAALPKGQLIDIPVKTIEAGNVDAFREDQAKLRG